MVFFAFPSKFETWKEQERWGWEAVHLRIGGWSRQRIGEWSFLQVIFGVCDSWIPFAPYSSRHHVSVSAASVRKRSWWRGRPQTASACAALSPQPFSCVCYSGSWKEKTPAGQHQYSTFHRAAKDLMSPGPASVQHILNLQFLPQKNRHYRPLFMIQALFCPELNQFVYKQLGSMGSFMSFSSHNADQ